MGWGLAPKLKNTTPLDMLGESSRPLGRPPEYASLTETEAAAKRV